MLMAGGESGAEGSESPTDEREISSPVLQHAGSAQQQ